MNRREFVKVSSFLVPMLMTPIAAIGEIIEGQIKDNTLDIQDIKFTLYKSEEELYDLYSMRAIFKGNIYDTDPVLMQKETPLIEIQKDMKNTLISCIRDFLEQEEKAKSVPSKFGSNG